MRNAIVTQSKQILLAEWARTAKTTALQELLAAASRPGITSFALGLPATDLFSIEMYKQAAADVLGSNRRSLQYGPPPRQLKKHIVGLMAELGVECDEEQVFLTAGAQQGISLLTRLLLSPSGGSVMVEEMAYPGFLQAIEPYRPAILPVATNPETGVDLEAIEVSLSNGRRPAFMYIVANGHNPLGVTLSAAKRGELAALARRYCTPIVEDDPYGFLYYDGQRRPPLRAFDDQWVIYTGTFSKILAPSLRVGWIIAPVDLIEKLSIVKEASDINTATFAQHMVCHYLDSGRLPAHLNHLRQEYRLRRDLMLQAMQKHFPAKAQWRKPTGGIFIWVELPPDIDAGELLKTAIEIERVAFIPGQAFDSGNQCAGKNCFRLNFSFCSAKEIEDGVARLGRVLRNAVRE